MLYYFQIAHGNFGDALNPWLWPQLAPEVCDPADPALFLGIGTVLSRRVPQTPQKVLFGSGCGAGPAPSINRNWHIYGVRGPRTAAKLGLADDQVLSDPALLIRRCELPFREKRYRLSFMPHHQSTFEADWGALCLEGGFHFIDPRAGVEHVLAEIQRTELLVTEAMHGAIVADALRVPWIPVRLYGHIVEFKWHDWAESLGITLKLRSLQPIFQRRLASKRGLDHAFKKSLSIFGLGKEKWKSYSVLPSTRRTTNLVLRAITRLATEAQPLLSGESVINRAEVRLMERLARVRSDWREKRFRGPV